MNTTDLECKKYILRKAENLNIAYRLFSSQKQGSVSFSLSVSIENDAVTDEEFAFDISNSEAEAEKIFELIWKNDVTPYSLDECLDSVYNILSV